MTGRRFRSLQQGSIAVVLIIGLWGCRPNVQKAQPDEDKVTQTAQSSTSEPGRDISEDTAVANGTPPEEKPAMPGNKLETDVSEAATRTETGKMRLVWESDFVLLVPPRALDDGVLACVAEGDTGARLVRASQSGEERWSVALPGRCMSPLLTDTESVYVRVAGAGVVCLALTDGTQRWVAEVDPAFVAESPVETWDFDGRWHLFERHGDLLFAASRKRLNALDLNGKVLWTNETSNVGDAFVLSTEDTLAILKAGVPTPFDATRGSSSWGDGNVYALQPDQTAVNRIIASEALKEAVGSAGATHFASAPVVLDGVPTILVQRYGQIRPAQIHYVTSSNGEKQAVGGSLDPPKPSGISLVQVQKGAITAAVDVTGETGHVTLATGPVTAPTDALRMVGDVLLFSTTDEKGKSVSLQAWGQDLKLRWTRDDLLLLGGSDALVFATWDESDVTARRNAAYHPDGKADLVTLDLMGAEVARLALPWLALAMPFSATSGGGMLYLTTPKRHLYAVSVAE